MGGTLGEVLGIALVTLGLGAALLLMFLEVGLSEDRAREEELRRGRRAGPRHARRRLRPPRRPRRP